MPREHGAWGLLLVPLFTGVVVGFASARHSWPLVLFTIAAICLFWMRTPLEALLGTGVIVARTLQERRNALLAAVALALVSAICLAGLMWQGRHLKLLLIGAIAALAFVLQVVLRRLGRETRMAAQVIGAVGLTSTAAAAYYLGAGRLDSRGLALWAMNWLFSWNQIHFVQLRIHAARAGSVSQKFQRGRFFFLAQVLLFAGLIGASFARIVPSLVILAFAPALVRGTQWFFSESKPLDVKRLGWSEMGQGIAFGILLTIVFIFS
ncbi:MAG TPA: YwiC-like family protein [Bryobacteraceae bacterium]|nr:YwiC-like family protein [Bryobacteraceae bacterium]